jgi:hypothetical protein
MNVSKGVQINTTHNTEALSIIKRKIRSCNIKVATIISKCEEFDKNNDNIIHSDDLEDILRDLLRDKMFSRRELRYLFEAIGGDKNGGNLVYNRLNDILDGNNHSKRDNRDSSRGDKVNILDDIYINILDDIYHLIIYNQFHHFYIKINIYKYRNIGIQIIIIIKIQDGLQLLVQ